MDRCILHSDCNNFYASVECLHRPELRDKPLVVGGDQEQRHGIVLAKNYIAKKYGITTGQVLWQAKQQCPGLVIIPPNFPLYLRFSRLAREIYNDYTDHIEPFGLDEAWLDITDANAKEGYGERTANEIRERIKFEMGITVSVGVSYNKIYAKLGSDMKKPDAVTVISKTDYKEKVWPQPAENLLYVGKATNAKLQRYGINTIGDIATCNQEILKSMFGKVGTVLWSFANGYDLSTVSRSTAETIIKSVGNSTTTARDIADDEDAKAVIYVLAESVATRMRESGFKCRTVVIHIRDNSLFSFERQAKTERATDISSEIAEVGLKIFRANYGWTKAVRTLGVRAADLVDANDPCQLTLFCDEEHRVKKEKLELTVDGLRRRFGYDKVQRALIMSKKDLTGFSPGSEHTIHPVSYF